MAHDSGVPDRERVIYVAGHRGMVGSALVRLLRQQGYRNLVTRSSAELDLTDQAAVRAFFGSEKIDQVILAAARVGGIHANNTYPAEFIYQNLMIQANVIHQSYAAGIRDLLFLGSSCIYPKFCDQPMKEEYLLGGALEPTNEPYAVAKIAGIKMCEAYNRQYGTSYRAVMPTNLYGPGDSYHLEDSHVIPAIIRKCHLAKLAAAGDRQAIARDRQVFGPLPAEVDEALFDGNGGGRLRQDPYVPLWGSGAGRREFLHVDDMAAACLRVLLLSPEDYHRVLTSAAAGPPGRPSFVNVGSGTDCTIREAAETVRQVVGFSGEIRYDASKPDGTPRKLLDVSRLAALGWHPRFTLREGVQNAYDWYCAQLV